MFGQIAVTTQFFLYGKQNCTKKGFDEARKTRQLPDILGDYPNTRPSYDGEASASTTLDLKEKVFMVTGANSGIGKEIAKFLAYHNAILYMVCRNPERGEKARNEIEEETKNPKVHLLQADVGLEEDVRRLWGEFETHQRENYGSLVEDAKGKGKEEEGAGSQVKLNALVCNAGALLNDLTLTKEGVETTFACHLLFGTYLLTNLAIPTLKNTADSRVVVVSSGGMYNTAFPSWDVVTCRKGKYDGQMAYARAKRGQVLLCERWAEMYPTDGTKSTNEKKKKKGKKSKKNNENKENNQEGSGSGESSDENREEELSGNPAFVSCHPGWCDTPGVDSAYGDQKKYLEPMRNLWEGSEGICWLCVAPRQELASGSFYLDRKEVVKHIAGPFFSEGSYTKNTREEVTQMVERLERWSNGKTRPAWEVKASDGALNFPLKEMQEKINLADFMGRWYVYAGIPSSYEAGTVNNIEDYTLTENGEVEVAFSCFSKDSGAKSVLKQRASMDNEFNTKWALRLQKFYLSIPLPVPYLLCYLDRKGSEKEDAGEGKGKEKEGEEGGQYQHCIVGVPNRSYLWVMGRKKEVDEEVMQELLDKSEELGFDLSKVVRVPYVDTIAVPPYGEE